MSNQATIKELFARAQNGQAVNGDAAHGDSAGPSQSAPKASGGGGGNKRLSVERIYQKKSQLEHILLRPDTYIGSVEKVTERMWVYDNDLEKMSLREITYVPGLYKIFDEILVNAADNKQRDSKGMDTIKINIDAEANVISIENNGKGIPVVHHKDEKMYVPTMIFGHLLTSSNYNDEEAKVTGGRNGYGAKLCNIFSTKFTVETACGEYKKSFKQSWANNMSKASEPKIKEFSGKDFTKVTFSADLAKFKMDKLDKDTVDLLSRRAYDVAGASWGVKVILNGKRIPVKGFKDYCEQYLKGKEDETGNPVKIIYERFGERWEVACCVSDQGFQQVSFVNSIATTKGGRHVDYICEQLTKAVVDVVKKKNKGGVNVKPFQVKNHLFLFVNCLIVNPTFDSQTKETMTLQAKSFGSTCKLSEKFVNSVLKVGVVDSVMAWAQFKAQTQLQKTTGGKKKSNIKGVPKLEDANWAGTPKSIHCSLILTEGDSAKALAVSGLSVIGRDKYGVFPLRGKVLNVREASHKQIMDNAEITALVKVLGLQYKKNYQTDADLATLRYRKIMIMTDQDQDGSHIKGLIINFIHANWPSLLKMHFVEEFITPIVKAKRGEKDKGVSFFSIPEFEEWKRATPNWPSYTIKYYKGLGTSTAAEAKDYFSDMVTHRIQFDYKGQSDDNAIVMAFAKKAADQRKEWLTVQMEDRKRRRELDLPDVYLYEKGTTSVTYTDFVNKELVLFSNADNERSIPSMVDGLKPGQRKVLFTCFKRKLDKREVKVAQLAGSVAEMSAYHHGEVSLQGTIVNLAQDFVGSNNINLLQPIGQFGTRAMGGKDAASARYIFTKLSKLARHLFNPHDDKILKYLEDDNQSIEPEWYMPILPMVLVNGASGIGTGWMTNIPNYNPKDILRNLERMMRDEEPIPMDPWYRNYKGHLSKIDNTHYWNAGEVADLGDNTIEITELPLKKWTSDYRENTLDAMLNGSEKTPAVLNEILCYHTDTTVRFVISMPENKYREAMATGLHKYFKLTTTMALTSMVLFDANGVIKRYDDVLDIMKEFFELRSKFYVKRKNFLVGMLQAEAGKLTNQARFIVEKCDGDLTVENKKKQAMIMELASRGYDSDPVAAWRKVHDKDAMEREINADADAASGDEESSREDASSSAPQAYDFNYLLDMKISTLTLEKKNRLLKERDEKQAELEKLRKTSPMDMWKTDLIEFEKAYDKMLDEEKEKEAEDRRKAAAGAAKDKKGSGGRGAKAPRVSVAEFLPSKDGIRIEPKIDAKDAAKYEKKEGGGGGRGRKKKASDDPVLDDDDEFGAEFKSTKTLAQKIGGSPADVPKFGEKPAKEKKAPGEKKPRARKPKGDDDGSPKKKRGPAKKKKRLSWESDESGDGSASGSEISFDSPPPAAPVERGPRRAAAQKKIRYSLDSDEEEKSDSGDEIFMENEGAKEADADIPKASISLNDDDDSDGGYRPSRKSPSRSPSPPPRAASPEHDHSESAFDDLFSDNRPLSERLKDGDIGSKPSSSSAAPPKPKAPPKKRALANPNDNFDFSDNSDDEGSHAKKPKKAPAAKKPKKVFDSDDDIVLGSDSDGSVKAKNKKPKKAAAPAAKKPKKPLSDSEDEFGGGGGGSGSDSDLGAKKSKKAPAKKREPKAKASPKKKAGGGRKKKGSDSDSDVIISDDDFVPPPATNRATTGRARAPIRYNFGESDDSD